MGIDNINELKPPYYAPTAKSPNPGDPANMDNATLLASIKNYDGEIWREDWYISLKEEAARRGIL